METVAFRMMLNPGMREEYERRHREIWPELVDALHNAGVRDYRIFLDEETHHLFAVLSRPADHTMDQLPALEIMRKWWDHMADIMQTAPDHSPLQQPLVPVFHLP
ncbi:L-rhamnose mutarotase [Paraburkholderia gardini]|uniref:L-rhamnose mutarotase n=1 Tax=Paraburkholderia gardini TaxID=2823469 RepID=A0ABN7QU68_9BURK|nr:L-rhamnose mutarotase [Paraburkholderia gardini]CAG4889719.1 L-rhamnose mutarotase [Paraburkholderia gardini]CAG4914259.1 L-rhamnose mutarotase [Paraburkholderia gardini]